MSDGKQNTSHENAIGWLILAVVFLALAMLFWYFFEYQVKDMIRWIRYAEMWITSLFVSDEYAINIKGDDIPFHESFEIVPEIPPMNLDDDRMHIINRLALEPLRIPIMVIIGLMGIWSLMFGPGTQYRRSFNLDGLIGAQAENFPIIKPFVKFNPSTMPPRPPGSPVPAELPMFAEALGPEEWLAFNQIPIPDGKLDEDATYMAFAKQLGPRWQGPMKLPPYMQIILAACCLKAARKRADADHMLGRLAGCWSHDKKLQLNKDAKLHKDALAVLKNRDLAGKTLAKCNQHAFFTTAMLRAMQTAREEGGVLAPAQFVWLRAHDRRLWYPLNNLGRQAFHMESLGAMSHFKAEKMTMRPIPKPKVDDAVTTIKDYMASARARPVPQLDYSGSKKRGIKKPKGGVKKPKK